MIKSIIMTVAIILYHVGNIKCTGDPLASKYGQLVFSTLLYRHGDRSIERTYPNDPYANKSYWPMGFGQLTPAGIKKHLDLGKWLRKRYSGWLPEVYSSEDVYVRSTDFDRTIMSAEANLAGMYPPVESKNWNGLPGKYVQFVPIHTVPTDLDNVLTMSTKACPLYSQEFDKLEKDSDIKKFYTQFNSVYEYIKNNTDYETAKDPLESTMMIYDSLFIESLFNYTLPEWTKKIFPEPLLTIVKEDFELSTHTNILKRIKSGPLLDEIVTHMQEKKNGTLKPDRMLWIYSAHDTTIVNFLNTIGLYERILVPYAAVLMIELRLNAIGNYIVTISYRNTSNHEPYLLHVPGCNSVACELDEFTNVLKPILSVDWYNECNSIRQNNFLELLIYLVGIVIVAVVIMIISYLISDKIVFCYRKRTDYQTYSSPSLLLRTEMDLFIENLIII